MENVPIKLELRDYQKDDVVETKVEKELFIQDYAENENLELVLKNISANTKYINHVEEDEELSTIDVDGKVFDWREKDYTNDVDYNEEFRNFRPINNSWTCCKYSNKYKIEASEKIDVTFYNEKFDPSAELFGTTNASLEIGKVSVYNGPGLQPILKNTYGPNNAIFWEAYDIQYTPHWKSLVAKYLNGISTAKMVIIRLLNKDASYHYTSLTTVYVRDLLIYDSFERNYERYLTDVRYLNEKELKRDEIIKSMNEFDYKHSPNSDLQKVVFDAFRMANYMSGENIVNIVSYPDQFSSEDEMSMIAKANGADIHPEYDIFYHEQGKNFKASNISINRYKLFAYLDTYNPNCKILYMSRNNKILEERDRLETLISIQRDVIRRALEKRTLDAKTPNELIKQEQLQNIQNQGFDMRGMQPQQQMVNNGGAFPNYIGIPQQPPMYNNQFFPNR